MASLNFDDVSRGTDKKTTSTPALYNKTKFTVKNNFLKKDYFFKKSNILFLEYEIFTFTYNCEIKNLNNIPEF